MSGLIDNLIKVSISISSGVENEESFNNILLVGSAPTDGEVSGVGVYSSAAEIAEAGWATDSDTYKAAAIAFSNGASELYVVVPEDGEGIEDTLNRALGTSGWYGFAVLTEDSDAYETIASWADTNNKLFGYTADCEKEIANPVSQSHNYAVGFATNSISTNANNAYIAIAAMAKCMTYQPGSETWAYKTLSSIVADEWTTSQISTLKDNGLNYYTPCAGKDITLDGKVTGGEYIDIIRFRDWLVNDMQTRIYNLFIKNAKVPYTDSGIALIQNQMIASLKEGQSVGGIAETEYDEDGNEIVGYSTSVPLASSVSDANKAARTLSNCTFTARLAGAIHLVEITGTLTT